MKLFKTVFIVTLLALTGAAGAQAQESDSIRVEVLTKTSSSWNGDALLNYESGNPEVTILRITIPAGMQLPMHRHPVINAGYLLKGKLTVMTEDGNSSEFEAGDTIMELVNKWHYGKNESDEEAEIVVFYAGVEGTPITVKKSDLN